MKGSIVKKTFGDKRKKKNCYFPNETYIYMNTKRRWMRILDPPMLPRTGMHLVELAVALWWRIRWDLRALVPLGFWANLMCREKRSSNTWDCRLVTAWVMQPFHSVPSPLSPLNEAGRAEGPWGQYGVCCEALTVVMRNQYSVRVGSKWIKRSQQSMKGEKKIGDVPGAE